MPNLYATPYELKAAMPESIRSTTTAYDALLARLSDSLSRFIDHYCRRGFYPYRQAKVFNGPGDTELWLPDLIEADKVEISTDGGLTYTEITNYVLSRAGDYTPLESYNLATRPISWPSGSRAVRITGWWGYTANLDSSVWEPTGIVLSAPYAAGGSQLTVADNSGLDRWGLFPALQDGQLLRIDDELFECVGLVGQTGVKVIPGRNGTAQADHDTGAEILVWRVVEPVKQAAIIMSVRQMERGFQGFGDSRANPEIGQLFYFKQIDPEAAALLSPLRRMAI